MDAPADTEAVQQLVREMLDHIALGNIVATSIAASRDEDHGHEEPETASVLMDAAYRAGLGLLQHRYHFLVELMSSNNNAVATFDFTLQVHYDVDDDYEPPAAAAEYFGETTGVFSVYPYARELAQSLATRLQFDPLIFGLMRRGGPIGDIAMVRRQAAPDGESG